MQEHQFAADIYVHPCHRNLFVLIRLEQCHQVELTLTILPHCEDMLSDYWEHNILLSLVASYRDLEDIIAEEMVDLNIDKKDLPKLINKLEKDMHKSAKLLDFERAAEIRDQLKKLREML